MSTDKSTDPNKLFRASLKGEPTLRIMLSKRDEPVRASGKAEKDSRNQQLGTIKSTTQPNEIVARKKGRFIKFYDMGQIRDGDNWEGLNYRFPVIVTPLGVDLGFDFNTPAASDYEDLADEIFAVALEDWETEYREIPLDHLRLGNFQLTVGGPDGTADSNDTSDPYFKTQGLQLPNSILNSTTYSIHHFMPSPSAFYSNFYDNEIRLTGTGKKHITSTRSFGASAVSYTPANGDKYFLLPTLNTNMTHFKSTLTGGVGYIDEFWVDDYMPLPRKQYLNPLSPHYHLRIAAVYGSDPFSAWLELFRVLDLFREVENNPVAYRGTTAGGGSVSSIDPDSVPDPTYWPTSSPDDGLGDPIIPEFSIPSHRTIPAGILVVVIKQGSSIFYVWS